MRRNCFYAIFAALLCCMMMPQGAAAKKVNYLGHEYRGDVNKTKVPFGEGAMFFDSMFSTLEGHFDGNQVTNGRYAVKKFKKYAPDYPKVIFEGNFEYDNSDVVTLKAGGVVLRSVRNPEVSNSKYKELSSKLAHASYLERERLEIILRYTPSDSLYFISDTIKMDVRITESYVNELEDKDIMVNRPVWLNTPGWLAALNPPTQINYGFRIKKGETGNHEEHWLKSREENYTVAYIPKDTSFIIKGDNGYTWKYVNRDKSLELDSVGYRDGSYFLSRYGLKDRHSDEYLIIGKNGVKFHNNMFSYTDGYSIDVGIDEGSVKEAFVENRMPTGYLRSLSVANDKLKTLDEAYNNLEDIVQQIKEKFAGCYGYRIKVSFIDESKSFRDLGEFRIKEGTGEALVTDMTFISQRQMEQEEARKEAAEARKEAAARATFKKKYGYDWYSSAGTVLRAGRRIDGLNEWAKHSGYYFTGAVDRGTYKWYGIKYIWADQMVGYLLVRGNVIASVTWY